jgi:hypothetical protein
VAPAPRVRRTPQPAIYRLLSPKQINRQAAKQAAATVAAQQAPIITQQKYADARSAAARQAMQSAGAAASSLLAPVGDQNAAAYHQATEDTGALIGGLSGSLGDQMRADQAASNDFLQQQAPGAADQHVISPEDAQNAVYDAGAVIPGSSLAAQGAAAATYGHELPSIPLLKAGQDQAASLGQQGIDDQQYVQQLLDIAHAEPQLRSQILDQLYGIEANKAQALTQKSAQDLYARQFGEKQMVDRANIRQGNIRLQLEGEGLRLRAQSQALAVKKAQVDWGRIDSSASKASGYLMYKNGQYVTDKNGKKIPVAASASGGGTGKNSKAYQSATGYAQGHLLGTPVANPAYVSPSLTPGVPRYLGRNGQPTDNPSQAKSTYDQTFVQAQNYLVQRYGLTRAQARKVLVGLGRKPDGKRPK